MIDGISVGDMYFERLYRVRKFAIADGISL